MYPTYGNYYNNVSSTADMGVWGVVSILVAICAGIVLYFTFLNPRNEESYTGTTKKIYDFLSFKTMSIEAILKVLYLVIAIYITISSFSLISTSFVLFLMVLVFGNIVARLCFEGALLIIMIYRRLNDCYNVLKPSKDEKKKVEKTEK